MNSQIILLDIIYMWVVNRLPKIKILEHHYLEFDIPKFKKKMFFVWIWKCIEIASITYMSLSFLHMYKFLPSNFINIFKYPLYFSIAANSSTRLCLHVHLEGWSYSLWWLGHQTTTIWRCIHPTVGLLDIQQGSSYPRC